MMLTHLLSALRERKGHDDRKEFIGSAVFAFIAISLLAPVLAQQRAPQNESIRQEDLRADLFFLAGDSLRGRLTDTEENRPRPTSSARASSAWVSSRPPAATPTSSRTTS
jgi:hypothetical protein